MATFYRRGKTWTVAYDGRLSGLPKGRRAYIHGLKSKGLAEKAKVQKDTEEQLFRAGLHKPEAHAGTMRKAEESPAADLVETWRKGLVNKGRKGKHAAQQAAHVRRLFKMAGVAAIGQIEPDGIQAAAARLMEEEGRGPRTANAALKAARQFSRWLAKTNRTRFDLLHDKLELYNEQTDVRRQRRELSQDEIDWLLKTTAAARDFMSRRCGIPPADRAMLYATGLKTGFRQSALLVLGKPAFYVDEKTLRPFVRLAAKFNKNGKDRDQPIPRDLAEQLRRWLATKPNQGPVWALSKGADLSLRFRRDMERARTAWINAAKTPKAKEDREASNFLRYVYHDGVRNVYADFHGLRHTGITRVVRSAGLRVGQSWADHSTPVLTARYAHLDLVDESKALDALPSTAEADVARQIARNPEKSPVGSEKVG